MSVKSRLCGVMLLLILSAVPGALLAGDSCWQRWLCDGRLGIDFAVQWWRPSGTAFPLAFIVTGSEEDSQREVVIGRSDFDLGYRVGGWYKSCCCPLYFGVWGQWITTHDQQRYFPPEGGTLQGFSQNAAFNELTNTRRVRYVTVDLEAGHQFAACCRLDSYLFGGFRYLHIDYKAEIFGTPVNLPAVVFSNSNPRLHGFGPRLGLGFNLNLGCYCAVHANLGSSLLFATRQAKDFFVVATGTVPPTGQVNSNIERVNNGSLQIDGRLGLEVMTKFRCFEFSLEGGWMLEQLIAGPVFPFAIGDGGSVSFIEAFSVVGPYVRISSSF